MKLKEGKKDDDDDDGLAGLMMKMFKFSFVLPRKKREKVLGNLFYLSSSQLLEAGQVIAIKVYNDIEGQRQDEEKTEIPANGRY